MTHLEIFIFNTIWPRLIASWRKFNDLADRPHTPANPSINPED